MGRVIIKIRTDTRNQKYKFESYPCKSKERAEKVAKKFRNLIEWNYYEKWERIPPPTKKEKIKSEMTLADMERIISSL